MTLIVFQNLFQNITLKKIIATAITQMILAQRVRTKKQFYLKKPSTTSLRQKQINILQIIQNGFFSFFLLFNNARDKLLVNVKEDKKVSNPLEESAPEPHDHGYLPYLHDMRKERDIFERPNKEKLKIIEDYKNEGNKFVTSSEYDKADYMYKKALLYLIYTIPTSEEDALYNKLNEVVNLNMSLVQLHLRDRKEALNYANEALKINPNNPKAHYRKIKALLEMDRFEEVEESLKDALQKNPTCTEILELKEILKERQKVYLEKSKIQCNSIFNKNNEKQKNVC